MWKLISYSLEDSMSIHNQIWLVRRACLNENVFTFSTPDKVNPSIKGNGISKLPDISGVEPSTTGNEKISDITPRKV